MFSYQFYKLFHILGLSLTLISIVWITLAYRLSKSQSSEQKSLSKTGFMLHGVGLLIMLVSGFGMAARLGFIQGLPMWVYIKIGIWIILGGLIAVAKRKSEKSLLVVSLTVLAVALAAYLAIYKVVI